MSRPRPASAFFVLLVATAAVRAADTPDFMAAVDAYEQKQYQRCADILTALQHDATPLPRNGELLQTECLGAAGHVDAALEYLDAQLRTGRIDLDDLRGKDRPGLNAVRGSPRWPALLAKAERLDAVRMAGIDQPLRKELLQRAQKDQAARQAAIDGGNSNEAWKRIEAIDHENTIWLKRIVVEKGWPGASIVGEDGAAAAWLLVQHADADPAFQAQVLPLIGAAVAKREASPGDFALLTDRVLRAQGKPQRYGTQFQTGDDGSMSMQPVEDEAGLDARRRAMGLPSMAEYRKMLSETYHKPIK